MNKIIAFIGLLLLPSASIAGTYWVSPTGAASWGSCQSASPLSGAAACPLETANLNAVAGDTIYLRGGTYSTYNGSSHFIDPANSGTLSNRITYVAHTGETPILEGNVSPMTYGAYIDDDYIVISSITVHESAEGIWIIGGNFNEVKNCHVYRDAPYEDTVGAQQPMIISNSSTHNWIHHNTIHGYGEEADGPEPEGSDGIREGTSGGDSSTNNTIEDNLIYHLGHACTEGYGKLAVWKNNFAHNEGWKPSAQLVYGTASAGTSGGTLIDTTKNFSSLGVSLGWYVKTSGSSDPYNFIRGSTVTAITTTTNPNDTISMSPIPYQGNPEIGVGGSYVISPRSYAPDQVGHLPGNGMYGHRTFGLSNDTGENVNRHSLFEGNRGGYASANPMNRGADGLMLGSPGNIVRFNSFYGNDGGAIVLKNFPGDYNAGQNNRIYNNTAYKYGLAQTGDPTADPSCNGVFEADSTKNIDNYLKNNIFYRGPDSSSCYNKNTFNETPPGQQFWDTNLCDTTIADLSCTAVSTLGFFDTTMTDPHSATSPNFMIDDTSDAHDAGTNLTLANGPGSSTTTLNVDDALYFQDGSWGSDLARGVTLFPDWVSVGTVGNSAEIESINYDTNVITLATPLSWSDNAPVWLFKNSSGDSVLLGAAPDIGAFEADGTTPEPPGPTPSSNKVCPCIGH